MWGIGSFFETGEEKAFAQTKGILRIAHKSNHLLRDIIWGRGSLGAIKRLERESSKEYFKISHVIVSGAIAPNLIDNMIIMSGKEENITDSVFKLSRQLLRYRIKSKRIADYVNARMREFNRLADSAIGMLIEMHGTKSIGRMRELRHRIKAIENNGDAVRDSLLDYAYKANVGFKAFYHITDLAYVYDDILDDCEDSSDIFMSIILALTT
ncbi:MAG: hypothetical protein M1321_02935 [Candidatus Marsarchaeota archaeon]|nr:hypothetical protein [Candidatus Marsarchaeota archaeon]